MKTKRLAHSKRREQIIIKTAELAAEKGLNRVTRNDIADALGMCGSNVQHHIQTMGGLRAEVMAYAVENGLANVVAQGLAVRDPVAMGASVELKALARQAL